MTPTSGNGVTDCSGLRLTVVFVFNIAEDNDHNS